LKYIQEIKNKIQHRISQSGGK